MASPMDLPGRLRSTTLGDLLGTLHRAGSTGTMELVEDRGRVHRIYLAKGLVAAVELDGTSPSLAEILRNDRAAEDDILRRSLLRAMASQRLHGEVLVEDFRVSPDVVGNALRRQVQTRLAALQKLPDARISFRVAVRPPRGALTGLRPQEFLHGRPRLRDRDGQGRPHGPTQSAQAQRPSVQAWRVLGLPPGADVTEIKRAYRRLARSLHPDLHPHATDQERTSLQEQFARVTDAFRQLVA
jgi:DnaJ-domain-containing protein 1